MTKNDSGTNSRSAGVYLLDKGYDRTFDKQSEEDSAPVKTKTIGILGSFSLIFNNLVGPAMLGFPNLFQQVAIQLPQLNISEINSAGRIASCCFHDFVSLFLFFALRNITCRCYFINSIESKLSKRFGFFLCFSYRDWLFACL